MDGERPADRGAVVIRAALAVLLAVLALPAHAACDAYGNCEIPLGTYHIALPEGAEDVPLVLWLHGAGGSGEAALRNAAGVQRWLDRGFAFAAPDGLPRTTGNSQGHGSWSFLPSRPAQRDEAAFLAAVADDIAARFPVDRDRIILAGFSIGGSLTSYIACDQPDLFDAYAPVAGSFWRPHPEGCAGPVDLFQTHGWRDTTVPLEGRPLGGGAIQQGDVWYAMQIWRQTNGCNRLVADEFEEDGIYLRRRWTTCENGSLEFALHPGGHGIPQGWSTMIMDWYDTLPQD